ncbi:MAG: hypothetical protein GC159_01570 [Phycisphaera sp.]|nr:hypothetical protein [Phycisphaera sp.]
MNHLFAYVLGWFLDRNSYQTNKRIAYITTCLAVICCTPYVLKLAEFISVEPKSFTDSCLLAFFVGGLILLMIGLGAWKFTWIEYKERREAQQALPGRSTTESKSSDGTRKKERY